MSKEVHASIADARVGLRLELAGQTIESCLQTSASRVELADVVPLARRLCEQVASRASQSATACGAGVCCRKTCSACCYAMVPVTTAEAQRLSREVKSLPPARQRRLGQRIIQTARTLVQAGPCPASDAVGVASWYTKLNLPCPFLENNQCVAYAWRPLACREQLAAGPAMPVQGLGCPGRQAIEPGVSVLESLAELESQLTGQPLKSLPLPLALLAEPAAPATFDTATVLSRFQEILHSRAAAKQVA